MLVIDVDGTLTDGKIYIGEKGEFMKAFNAHDAVGVRKLSKYDIVPVIITGRKSQITLNRAIEMNMEEQFVFQDVSDKLSKLKELISDFDFEFQEVAYIGDDENDLDCLKKCGIRACPKNAISVIKNECNFISKYNGGDGAVRELIEYIIRINNKDEL